MRAGLTAALVLAASTMASAADRDLRLVQAVAQQDRAAVRTLIDAGVDVNAARADGATALLWAAHWDDLEIVDLAARRAGQRQRRRRSRRHAARARLRERQHRRWSNKLLGAGADPNRAQTSGLTPLMIAARTGNLEVVKALLAHGANVNAATTGRECDRADVGRRRTGIPRSRGRSSQAAPTCAGRRPRASRR